jgi:hypothetical protein
MPLASRMAIATLATALIGCSCWAQAELTPRCALWLNLKRQMAGPNGIEYFNSKIKRSALPVLEGTLISALIRDGLSKLTMGLTDSETPEVTLIFHTGNKRVKGHPKRGTPIAFEGIAVEFTKDPFMLTFDVLIDQLWGLELEPSKPSQKEAPPAK